MGQKGGAGSGSLAAEQLPSTAPLPSASAFSGVQYLMGLQLFVRIATFITNAVVAHLAGRSAFGIVSVRFELLLSTILFLSREGVRNALLRIDQRSNSGSDSTDGGDNNGIERKPLSWEQRVINLSVVPILVGMVLAGLLYMVWGDGWEKEGMPYYRASLVVYVVAAWVELLVEPLFVLSRARVEFKLQARSEAFSVSMRCLATATVLVVGARQSKDGSNQYQLLAFALGQLAYASSILASYAWQMQSLLGFTLRQCYIPRKVTVDDQQESVLVGRHMQSLVAVFVGQSLLKHVLTQGDSMVMAKYAKPDEMGIFALVSSYASIPARILFLPLEEAARAVFPHCDASTAKRVLTTLFRLQTLLGSLACVFGGLYAPVLLPLLGQDQAVARVLAAYCFYLPLMGVNGFLEAYVHSVVARRQLLWVNVCMALCSIAYVSLAALLLTRWDMGGLGMVVANMVNMALRILGCCWFASLWFAAQKVALPRFTELVPHPAVSVACCLSAVLSIVAIQSIGQESVLHRLATMATGSLLASLVLATIWRYEQPFIRAVLELRSGKFIKHEKTD